VRVTPPFSSCLQLMVVLVNSKIDNNATGTMQQRCKNRERRECARLKRRGGRKAQNQLLK